MTVGGQDCPITVYDALYVDYDCQGAIGDSIMTSTPDQETYAVNFCGIEARGVPVDNNIEITLELIEEFLCKNKTSLHFVSSPY